MSQEKYNELEARFKQLSENATFEYQPSDWTAVEQMLDEENKDRPLVLFLLSGVLALVVGGWFLFSNSTPTESSTLTSHSELNTNEHDLASTDRAEKTIVDDIENEIIFIEPSFARTFPYSYTRIVIISYHNINILY